MKQSKFLKKLLTASERSLITIDQQFMIIDTSYGAERFSEQPYESLLHKDIRHGFPEIIGLEETFDDIWLNKITSFELKGISRSTNSKKPLYFNLYILGTNELEESDRNILICIEDATEMMVMSQILMQRANEAELLANDLKKSNEYIDKVVLTMAESLIVTDYQGNIKTINIATVNLFGYANSDLIGNPITLLFKDPSQLDYIYQNLNQNLNQNLDNIEILCLSKNKEKILISFACSKLPNYQFNHHPLHQNLIHDIVYLGRDITELKRKEQELLVARQIAEQSTQAKSIFLANMSHEIRTPINGVLGMTELLLGTSLGDRQQDFVENIRLSGDLLLSLINQILDLSKLEAGALELENLPFNLEKWMEETLELFALQAHSKGLELSVNFDPDLPVALIGDTMRLRQIMINLIGNAIKFTASGEVFVQIERDRHNNLSQSQIYLRFSIIDTGIGIEPSNQEKLFKSFSQVDASTTRHFGGTGLGLAISRQLVELMQGQIGISSPVKDGRGTCFWFTIPFGLQTQSQLASLSDYNAHALINRHILVVDENQHSRNALCYYLTRVGATVSQVTNTQEAIASLDNRLPSSKCVDVALIDWRSTNLDGTKSVLEIKQKFTDLPLIAMLITDHQGEIQSIIDQGFCGYVTKPFKGDRLLKAIFLALKIEIAMVTNSHNHLITSDNISEINESIDLSNLQILVAEDNVVNQKITMTYLSRLGYQADLAVNGKQVLELTAIKDYDLILMDCQMPILDGYTATQAIRQLENQSSRHTVIIAMTANAFKEDRDRCLAAGMDDYLTKPVRKEQIKKVITHWMTQIKARKN